MSSQYENSHLGKYQILEELGKGGFATVFRARDPDLDREVALKVLDPLLTRDPVWVERFRQEAKAIARLKHPRIITIHEIGQSEGSLYIATEMVEGGSLADHIAARGRLSWEETVQLVGEIAEALGYAHSQGVLHRDMKPANVLLDPGTGAILTDFGFARIVADHSLSVSMSGGVVGTPAYIAPEVWHGDKANAQTDIYALGCILYEMVTGTALFTGATPPAVMLSHFQPPALPDGWPDDVPSELTEVLDKALAREPDQRYATAGELAEALAALSGDRLAEPYAALEQAIAEENWQQALALAAEVQETDSAYRDVAALEQMALAGVEEEARQAKLAQLQYQAEQAIESEEWQQVLALVEEIKTLDPTDEDVVNMERQALEGMEVEAKRQEIAELKKKALQRLSVRYWKEALDVVDEIKVIDPDNEDAEALEQQALAGMEEDAKKQQASQWQEAVETALAAGNLQAVNLALAQWAGLGSDDDRIAAYRKRMEDEQAEAKRQQREKEDQEKSAQESLTTAKTEKQPSKKETQATTEKRQPPVRKPPPPDRNSQEPSPGFKWIYLIPIVLAALLGGVWISNSMRPNPTPMVEEKIVEITATPQPATSTPRPATRTPIPPTKTPIPATDTPVKVAAVATDTPISHPTPTVTPIATLGVVATSISPKDNMELVRVPAGVFIMGSKDDELSTFDEKPFHTVHLNDYWIDKSEVNNDQYRGCVEAESCQKPFFDDYDDPEKANHPVIGISWNDARTYCLWARRRLPTEAEWEKAARGTDRRIYPWGDSIPNCTKAQYVDCYEETVPSNDNSAGASPIGTLNMAGNVFEWTADWYGHDYYAQSPDRNPLGPQSGETRVVRGGSWSSSNGGLRSADRSDFNPDLRYDNVGFRCALSE